jgi:hypothetical protein
LFIDVVQFTDNPQGIVCRELGVSLVWLRRANLCNRETRCPEYSQQSLDAGTVLELRRVVKDWKLDPSQRALIAADRLRHCVNDVVKARAKLMNKVSDDDPVLKSWFDHVGCEIQLPIAVCMEATCKAGHADGFTTMKEAIGARRKEPEEKGVERAIHRRESAPRGSGHRLVTKPNGAERTDALSCFVLVGVSVFQQSERLVVFHPVDVPLPV